MFRRRTLALALAATALTVAGCGEGARSRSGTTKPTVDVGYAFGYSTGDVADRIAFARLEHRSGIRFRIRELGGVANAVVALLRGDVQLATMPYSTAVRAVGERAGLHVVLGADMATDLVLVGRDGITGVRQLQGGRVADDGPGLDGETLVLLALTHAGVPRSAVRLTPLDSAPRASALAAGRVDAAVLQYPDYERLLAQDPGLGVLAELSAFRPRSAETVWVVSNDYERLHRPLVRRLVTGLLDGYAYAYRPAGRRAWLRLARRTALKGEDPALATRLYAYYRRVRFWPLRDEPVTAAEHRRTVRFWLRMGQLERYVPFDRVWDESFWRASER